MDFFQRQDNARRKTSLFVLLFIIAVLLVIAAVNGTIFLIFKLSNTYDFDTVQWWLGAPAAYTALGTLLVIVAGSLTRYIKLGSGGVAVAKMAGAVRVDLNSRDSGTRTYINVVEEMSIAAGLPVPEIFVMPQEQAINAFVAGYTPADTVVVITQGALETLSRDELQGVIGHEFSHILHADTLINLRLMALLAGILFIGDIGQYLMRSSGRRRYSSRRSKEEGGMFLLGLALAIIGYVGVFMGRLIKAAVSRQREFLADASSVQFTRNPEGIAGALFTIGEHSSSSFLTHTVQAESMNHMCFGETVKIGFSNLLASHPPIRERIDALGGSMFARVRSKNRNKKMSAPSSDHTLKSGEFPEEASGFASSNQASAISTKRNATCELPPIAYASPEIENAPTKINSFTAATGQVSVDDVDHARSLLQRLPEEARHLAHTASGAALIVIGLIAKENNLTEKEIAGVYNQPIFNFPPTTSTATIITLTERIDNQLRMPLMELCSPTLKTLTTEQRESFLSSLFSLAKSDGKISLFEFLCLSFLELQLPSKVRKPKIRQAYKLNELGDELATILTLIYQAGMPHQNEAASKAILEDSISRLCGSTSQQLEKNIHNTRAVSTAFNKLRDLSPLLKPAVLEATTDLILADNIITTKEYDLLRVVAACMDCPMPALMVRK